MKVYALLARQRSGTGALGTVLDQQSGVKYVGEIFHDDRIGEQDNFFTFLLEKVNEATDFALPGARARLFSEYLRRLECLYAAYDKIILDVKYRSLHHFGGFWQGPREMPGFIRLCIEHNVAIIHLTRRNLLKTHISGILAERNRVWHARSQDEVRIKTIRLDPAHVTGALRSTRNEVEFVKGFLRQVPKLFELDYQDAFDAGGSLVEAVGTDLARFLEINDFVRKKPVYMKQTSDDLASVIENFAEVKAALEDTEYAWMVEVAAGTPAESA